MTTTKERETPIIIGRWPARRWRTGQLAPQTDEYTIDCDGGYHTGAPAEVQGGEKFPACNQHRTGATYRPAPRSPAADENQPGD